MTIKKLAAGFVSSAALMTTTTISAMANTTSAPYHPQVKSIYMNGQCVSRPYGIVSQNTTYMPIWYVIQVLNTLGVQNSWDGTNWTLTAPSNTSVDLNNIPTTHGSNSIILNGTPIYHIDRVASTDPASNVTTTYMPIWYIEQVLNRVGIQSNWDGFAWTLTNNVGTSSQAPSNYTVQSGDSLWGISQKFGVPISTITTQNGIENANTLYAGQVISIPSATSDNPASSSAASATSQVAQPETNSVESRSDLLNQLVQTAKSYLGAHPYVWGGTSPTGWDCSGYISYVFKQNQVPIPRVSRDEYNVGAVVARNQLQPGDLVFFGGTTSASAVAKTVSHVGMYVGGNNFIQESSSQNAVVISSLSNSYWAAHYVGARRMF